MTWCSVQVMEPDETFDPDVEEPEEELTFNNMALKNAVRRNMSIWRSHGTVGERQKYPTTDDEEEIIEEDDDDDDDDDDESESVVHALAADTANTDGDDEWCCEDSTAAGIILHLSAAHVINLVQYQISRSAK